MAVVFTVYNLASGRITKTGVADNEAGAGYNAAADEGLIIGEVYDAQSVMIRDGHPVPLELTADELAEIKADLCGRIDRAAGAARAGVITVAPGQDYIYAIKLAEAGQVIRDAVKAAEVPLIAAEAEADGMSLAQKACQIVKASRQCALALSTIEIARRAAKRAVGLAKTKSEAEAAASIDWSTL